MTAPRISSRLRILHIIDSGGLYGAERVLLTLAAGSVELGHDVTVGTIVSPLDSEDALGSEALKVGLPHVVFPMADGPNLKGWGAILRFLKEHKIDVLHCHGYKTNVLATLSRKSRRPCVFITTLHGWTGGGSWDKLALYEWLERLLLPRFDHVVVVSESLRQRVGPKLGPGRLSVVRNGIDTRAIAQRLLLNKGPDTRNTSRNRPRIVGVGRLSYEKGFDLLLDAVDMLRRDGIFPSVMIAGAGHLQSALSTQIDRLGLGAQVRLLGFREDTSSLLRDADLFVLPSRSEAMPLALLEAMCSGVPVVATPVGEVPAVLDGGRFGWLTKDVTVDAIASAIKDWAAAAENWSELHRTTVLARKRVEQDYSKDAMVAHYQDIYLDAISRAHYMSR